MLEGVERRWGRLLAGRLTFALVPLLAIAAYATVLRIGFLGDDFILVVAARSSDIDFRIWLPDSDWFFYRPLGTLLTWQIGWKLWGFNPWPYHLLGLAVHAVASTSLGLWLATATSRRSLGLLGGALFAVFPGHLEAVGWLAAQWDAWAALFGLTSLLLFTVWWRGERGGGVRLYLLCVLCYVLGVFTKESVFSLLPVFALSAWLVTPRFRGRDWRRLALALLPLVGALALNAGLRLIAWGRLGGYEGARTDFAEFFWDGLIAYCRLLLSPINTTVLGAPAGQIVGALSGFLLLMGLLWYGRQHRRLLVVAGAWVVLTLAPVLNLAVGTYDLGNNRFLYLPAAGYCAGVAALMHSAILAAGRWRKLATGLAGVLALTSIATCWVQLRPWHIATTQVQEIEQSLARMIPFQPRPSGFVWYVENLPVIYKGAHVLNLGLGVTRSLTGGDSPALENVPSAANAPLAADHRDAFALRFSLDEEASRFRVDYAAGVTRGGPPPSGGELGENAVVWDFRGCSANLLDRWQISQAQARCEADRGLLLHDPGPDAQMLSPSIDDVEIKPVASGARFVRLRVSVQYPAASNPQPYVSEWFWKGPGGEWKAEQSRSMPIKQDGKPHVYWTFIPAAESGDTLAGLRFDPANATVPAQVQWIAVDLVR